MKKYIVISGIPACGKTTLGKELAPMLNIPFLDKDDILEAMYDSLGIGDSEWREHLSRSADEILKKLVLSNNRVMFTSWWRHPKSDNMSGTCIDWISAIGGEIIELYCCCDTETAMGRFKSRIRHKGHLDDSRGEKNLIPNFEKFASYGPLGLGRLIKVSTTEPIAFDRLMEKIKSENSQANAADR